MPTLVERLFPVAVLLPACGPAVATISDGAEGSSGGVVAAASSTTQDPAGSTSSAAVTTEGHEPGSSSGSETSELSSGPAVQLTELRIEPAYAILDSASGGQAREFAAIATTDTGDELDVTARVQWSLDGPGLLDAGTLTSPESKAPIFERAEVTAALEGLSAEAHAVISVRTQGAFAPQLFNLSSDPPPRQLDFRPTIEKVDVFFLVDTVSYAGEEYLPSFHERVTNLIVPQLQAEGLDVQFGAGGYSAFPLSGSGEESCGDGQGDQPFTLWSEISPDLSDLEQGLAPTLLGEAIGCLYVLGSFGEALYQIATGVGLDGPGATYVEPNVGARGGVGFREDSLAVVVSTVYDGLNSGLEFLGPVIGPATSVAHTPLETVSALQTAGIVHVGQTQRSSSLSVGIFRALLEVASDTGARVPPGAWTHPELGRPDGCAEGACCLDRARGIVTDLYEFCPLGSSYDLAADPSYDTDSNIARDFYALIHYLLTDVSTSLEGEPASVSGDPLPDGTTSASFLTVAAIEADAPPLPGAPNVVIDEGVFRNVIPNTNLNYEVTIDAAAVPAVAGEPRLYRVRLNFETGYRPGLRVQEFWIISPPLEE